MVTVDSKERMAIFTRGKVDLLNYLMAVGQKTQGAEVWRALFAEMLAGFEAALEQLEAGHDC